MTDDGFAAWHAANCGNIVDGQCSWESDEHALWTAGRLAARSQDAAVGKRLRESLEAIYQMRDPWKMRYEADSALGTFRLGPPVPPTDGPQHG